MLRLGSILNRDSPRLNVGKSEIWQGADARVHAGADLCLFVDFDFDSCERSIAERTTNMFFDGRMGVVCLWSFFFRCSVSWFSYFVVVEGAWGFCALFICFIMLLALSFP